MMAKKLKLTFNLEGEGTMDVTLSSPNENLDAAAVQTAAADIVPALANASGVAAESLAGAVYITTEEEVIV